jgi:splicing factor 3B subunit 2
MVAQISSVAVNGDVEKAQAKVNGGKAIKSKNQLRRLKAKQKKVVRLTGFTILNFMVYST